MFCEASALYLLPTLSLDPVGEQVQANTHVLQSLESAVRGIEQKIASLVSLSSSVSVNTASNGVSGATCNPTQQSVPSYANVASTSLPRPTYTNHPSRIDVRISRECNVILFGLPENNSIVETKSEIDEVFEFLVGKAFPIKDLFRLGKPTQSLRPRPLLIKLSTIWDRKLLLSRKRNLREYKIARLFLREDVPPDHRLRQKRSTSAKLDAEKSSTSLLQFRSTLLFLVLLIVLPHLLSLTPQLPQLPLLIQWYCLKMILIMANLRCCTFNCRGWNSGYLSIKNFIDPLIFASYKSTGC